MQAFFWNQSTMDCSMPGFPILHYLLKFAQTHVHWVDDAIQPSHPLSSPSPPVINLSQHQGLFQWVRSSHKVAKYWSFSFSITPSSEYSGDWFDLLAVQGIFKSSPAPQFESINSLVLSHLYVPTLAYMHDYWKIHSFGYTDLYWQSNVSAF